MQEEERWLFWNAERVLWQSWEPYLSSCLPYWYHWHCPWTDTIQQHACATQAHLAIPTLNSALIKENTVRQNRQLNCGNQWHLLWKVAQLLLAFNLKGRWNLLLLNCFPSQHCSSHYILIPLFRFLGAQPSVLMWNWWLDGHCICLSTVWQQIRRKGRDKKAEIYRHFNKNVLEDSSWP